MKTVRYIFILFFQLGWLPAFSQKEPLRFEHLNTDVGLSNNHVNFIFKDQKGFMWFGTESGLSRYDGSGFKIFQKDEKDPTSLSDNYILRIFDLPDGKIGVKTLGNELNIYDPVTERFERNFQNYLLRSNLPNGEISDVKKDIRGNYWFLYENIGLYKYVTQQCKAIKVQLSNDSMNSRIMAFSPDSKGDIWLIYADGYLEKIDSELRPVLHNTYLQINKDNVDLYSLYIDAQDELWIGAYDLGVYYYKPKTGNFVFFHEESSAYRLNSNTVTMNTQNIVQDNEGKIWIATDQGGINLVDKKDLSVQYVVHDRENNMSISQNANLCVYKDNEGVIWTGTYKQGVNSYDKNRSKFSLIKKYSNDPNSLPYEDVNRFAEDAKGNLWIGTNGGGLIYFDRKHNKFTQFLHDPADPNSLCGNIIVSLYIDTKQNLWIGTYMEGMDCYDGKKFTHYRHNRTIPQSLAENNVWEIFQDSRQIFWIGTIENGLDRFDPESKTFFHYRNGLSKDSSNGFYTYIAAITEDNSGNILIGTGSGLEILDKQSGKFDRYTLPFGKTNNHIFDIKIDSRGLIWIATRYGINLFNPQKKTFRVFQKQDGLPDEFVLTILEDKDQSLWLSTPKGLCNMTIIQNGKDSISAYFKNYTVTDGLQGKEFNENAAFKTKAGELVFGGPFGINIFKPEKIMADQAPPGIVLTDFQIFNKSIKAGEIINGRVILNVAIPETKTIILKYDENLFSIKFASLDFSHTKIQRFEYMLEGFNNGWVVSNGMLDNRATYTNLDPGVYNFKIKTVDIDGISSKVLSLKITIIPPLWMKWWFRLLIGLAIIGTAVLFYKVRMNIVKMQKEKLEISVQERTESLAQAIEKAEQMNTELGRKNKELEEFAYVASHDLQEPLRTSSSYIELFQRHYKGKLDERADIYLSHIANASGRMRVLITDLLDYSRIGNKMELQQIDCNALLGQILEDLSAVIGETRSEIVAEQLPVVNGYYTELRVLFQNLIINAIKFRKKDTFPRLHISALEKNDCFHFSFKDNGIGIEEKQGKKIFVMFQRLHTRSEYEGSGIGLSQCKKIAELHNGTIWVESVLTVGSTFHFTISRNIKPNA
jgi:ligand-binding sensor domain-containing protein/signal transduction histidine kinase